MFIDYTVEYEGHVFMTSNESLLTKLGARLIDFEYPKFAWPGGYPIFYWVADSGVLCPGCANENKKLCSDPEGDQQWRIVAQDINWESLDLECDHCLARIPAAYRSDEDEE